MKILFLLSFTALLTVSSAFKQQKNVYICTGKSSEKYHFTKTCRGLNACKHEIIPLPKDTAISKGYTLCGWED